MPNAFGGRGLPPYRLQQYYVGGAHPGALYQPPPYAEDVALYDGSQPIMYNQQYATEEFPSSGYDAAAYGESTNPTLTAYTTSTEEPVPAPAPKSAPSLSAAASEFKPNASKA